LPYSVDESHIYETISILSTEPPLSDVKEVPASANQQAPAQPVSPPPVQHALIPIPLVPPVSLQCCIQVNNCVVRLVYHLYSVLYVLSCSKLRRPVSHSLTLTHTHSHKFIVTIPVRTPDGKRVFVKSG